MSYLELFNGFSLFKIFLSFLSTPQKEVKLHLNHKTVVALKLSPKCVVVGLECMKSCDTIVLEGQLHNTKFQAQKVRFFPHPNRTLTPCAGMGFSTINHSVSPILQNASIVSSNGIHWRWLFWLTRSRSAWNVFWFRSPILIKAYNHLKAQTALGYSKHFLKQDFSASQPVNIH